MKIFQHLSENEGEKIDYLIETILIETIFKKSAEKLRLFNCLWHFLALGSKVWCRVRFEGFFPLAQPSLAAVYGAFRA